jgi:hypothetical protein
MNISNLARRLDEFAAVENEARATARQGPQLSAAATQGATGRARRRLALATRRIQIRDCGLRNFRVF